MNALLADGLLLDRRLEVVLEVLDAFVHDVFGALAPAVIRTVSTLWNQVSSISSTPSIKNEGIPSPLAISASRLLFELF